MTTMEAHEVSTDFAEVLIARVVAKSPVAHGVVEIALEPRGEVPSWQPGAHVDVELPDGTVRQYSLCSEAGDSYLKVAVLREHEGRGGSRFIHDQLTVGDEVTLSAPRNHFELEPADEYLFVAGGIGITPILSMLRAASQRNVPWRLVYGGRNESSMAYLAELRESFGDRLTVYSQEVHGVIPLERELATTGPNALVYACGPTAMLDAIAGLGVTLDRRVRMERFVPVETDAGDDREVRVELKRTGVTVDVPADKSILEAVEAAGVRVLNSCRQGTCGSCEVEVLDGVPDHRDSLLDEDEKAAGDTMMICVSRAKSESLILDI